MPKKKKEEKKKVEQDILIDNRGTVEPLSIVEEMETSYIDYAMSVIVSRHYQMLEMD